MVTDAETVAGVLRGLAERLRGCSSELCACSGACKELDPRFEALRCEGIEDLHIDGMGGTTRRQHINTDLESIVRAAAACGWNVEVVRIEDNWPDFKEWKVSMVRDYRQDGTPLFAGQGEGASPEEAAAKALAAAVEAQDGL